METMFSKRSEVLAIPELLENILSLLPEREILTSVQRVSRTWRSAVVNSPRIQKKLFMPKERNLAVSPVRMEEDDLEVPRFGDPIYEQSVVSNHLLQKVIVPYPHRHIPETGWTCVSQKVKAGDSEQVWYLGAFP